MDTWLDILHCLFCALHIENVFKTIGLSSFERHKPRCESIDAFEADSGIPGFYLVRFIYEFHNLVDIWFLTFSEKI